MQMIVRATPFSSIKNTASESTLLVRRRYSTKSRLKEYSLSVTLLHHRHVEKTYSFSMFNLYMSEFPIIYGFHLTHSRIR